MKPASFQYVRPKTLDEAIGHLSAGRGEAKLLAGGQSLLPAMNMRLSTPEMLIDLSDLAELRGIRVEKQMLRIGAMTRHAEVMKSAEVARHAPLIASAVAHVAHAAIRNRGTFGGSLCNADPASEMPACIVALDALFNVVGPAGERTVTHREFFVGTYATCLEDDEILVSIDVPIAAPGTLSFFDELCRRKGDYAMAGLAAQTRTSDGRFTGSRFTYFGIGEMPMIAATAQATLDGSRPGETDGEAIVRALDADFTPFDDLTTSGPAKMAMSKVLARRAIAAFGEAGVLA